MPQKLNENRVDEIEQGLIPEEAYNFDYADVSRRLGEAEEVAESTSAEVSPAEFFRAWALWVLQYRSDSSLKVTEQVGRRFLALAWLIDPGLIPGSPSLRKLAAQLGIKVPVLSELTSDLHRRWGLTNRATCGSGTRIESLPPKPLYPIQPLPDVETEDLQSIEGCNTPAEIKTETPVVVGVPAKLEAPAPPVAATPRIGGRALGMQRAKLVNEIIRQRAELN
jgi:hypothetical protein